jgi:uncharacterized RDD family membrane protein YckC
VVTVGVTAAFVLRDSTTSAGGAITGALLLSLAGFLWAAFDPHRRTLHDRIAGTIVVRLQ